MATKWSSKTVFPRDNFVLRCTDASFERSKSKDNPMITLGFEVVSPEEYEIGGEQFTMAGVNGIKYYCNTVVFDEKDKDTVDAEKTAKAQERTKELFAKFGLPNDNIDFHNPPVDSFKGKLVHCLMNARKSEQRKAPTSAQLAQGIKQGDVIKNPVTGEPLLNYWPQVEMIYGVAQADSNKPF